jgi:hypothetical protein
MTKYYRSAEDIFDDSAYGQWMNNVFEFLVTLWTGNSFQGRERPPLWMRRWMLILFPLSYALLGLTIGALFVLFIATALTSMSVLGLINFYRRRWSD